MGDDGAHWLDGKYHGDRPCRTSEATMNAHTPKLWRIDIMSDEDEEGCGFPKRSTWVYAQHYDAPLIAERFLHAWLIANPGVMAHTDLTAISEKEGN